MTIALVASLSGALRVSRAGRGMYVVVGRSGGQLQRARRRRSVLRLAIRSASDPPFHYLVQCCTTKITQYTNNRTVPRDRGRDADLGRANDSVSSIATLGRPSVVHPLSSILVVELMPWPLVVAEGKCDARSTGGERTNRSWVRASAARNDDMRTHLTALTQPW